MIRTLVRYGADETVVKDGFVMRNEGRCSCCDRETSSSACDSALSADCQASKDRIHSMLALTPADRAWRHRGWAVVLWARTRRASMAVEKEKQSEHVPWREHKEQDAGDGGLVSRDNRTYTISPSNEEVFRSVMSFM